MIGTGVTELVAEAVVARRLETTGHEIINLSTRTQHYLKRLWKR